MSEASGGFTVELLQRQNRDLRGELAEAYETIRQMREQLVEPEEVPGWFPHLTRFETATWLCLQSGRLVSRDQLMDRLYGDRADNPPLDKIIDVFICKLRRKLPPEIVIETVWGQGWRITQETRELLALAHDSREAA